MLYCPTCRDFFSTDGEQQPPYAVIHTVTEPPTHLHPITRGLVGLAVADDAVVAEVAEANAERWQETLTILGNEGES